MKAHSKSDRRAAGLAAGVAQISAAASDIEATGRLGGFLRTEFEAVQSHLLSSTRNGAVISRRLSGFTDRAVTALFAQAAHRFPDAADRVALVAIGGFGRGRLAPQSDIDLLFLHQFKDETAIRPVLDFILYPLFDASRIVSQCVHTPSSARAFAKEDMVARTSFLDHRFLCGDDGTYRDFSARFDRLRLSTKRAFVKAKLEEQEARHDLSSQSRFLAEPDVKEGKGGLRDLDLLRWLHKYVFDEPINDETKARRVLAEADYRAFQRAEKFLWSIRVHLHDLRGRADERLSFEIQPKLAERLKYAERPDAIPAERLMKHYFTNAAEVGRLTRIICARIEEEQIRLSARAPKLLPVALLRDEAPGRPNLRLKNGRLDFERPRDAAGNPRDFLRLFRAFSRRPDLDFSPDALALIAANAAAVTQDVRRDPVANTLFIKALMKAKDPVKLMRVMGETGLLAKFLPFFAALQGRITFGLYRRYTVDEHVFQAIGVLSAIDRGVEREEHPLASEILGRYPDRTPFYLVVLLYEARFSISPFSEKKMRKLVARIASRFCAHGEDVVDIEHTASNLGRMIEVAKRRNLSDRRTISKFAEDVATPRRLDLYLVMSICHLRVVGTNTWDVWTRDQLADLYAATTAYFSGGAVGVEDWLARRADAVRAEANVKLSHWLKAERIAYIERAPSEIVRSLNAEQLVRFANLARSAQARSISAAVDARLVNGVIEAMVYTDDRRGLLADLAGAVAAAGASVRTVLILTSADDKAVDIFTIQSLDGTLIEDDAMAATLQGALEDAARRTDGPAPVAARRVGDRRRIFDVPAEVRIDLDASDDCVVVEAEGRDRPGLLFKLSSALSDIGVTIKSAHIATYGERAVDTFYLRDAPGYKITNKRRLQSIERRLLNVLNADD